MLLKKSIHIFVGLIYMSLKSLTYNEVNEEMN